MIFAFFCPRNHVRPLPDHVASQPDCPASPLASPLLRPLEQFLADPLRASLFIHNKAADLYTRFVRN